VSLNSRYLGKYELRERLGRGGMAEVWKALDPQLQRFVAIKFVQSNLRADPTFVTRFVREAQAVASLRHPNIVRIYDFESSTSDDEDSMAYMVMDYVEGETLADYIHDNADAKRFPSNSEIAHLFIPIGSAIEYAHQHGMIHRDIKPANILLDKHNTAQNPMGEPILSDFGIAKIMGTATGTLTGSSIGTPLYIAPEQAKGQTPTEASDIYSLGVTLYETATGRPPFLGDSPFAIIHQHISDAPPAPRSINPNISPQLESIILRCLAKNPEERFPSAAAFTNALKETLELSGSSTDISNQHTIYGSRQLAENETILASSPSLAAATGEAGNTPAGLIDMLPTVISRPLKDEPAMPLAAALPSQSEAAQASVTPVRAGSVAPETPPSSTTGPAKPPAGKARSRRGLYTIVVAALIIVIVGGGLGAYFAFFHTPANTAGNTTSTAIVGHGFFTSSGAAFGNNLGINDTFDVSLSRIPAPAAGKSYYAWLLPDANVAEGNALALGTLSNAGGTWSLTNTYTSPQHINLIGQYSRLLITEEPTNPAPVSYTLDKTKWRYYAEIPQSPPATTCEVTTSINQLNDLCHVRHLLSNDPDLEQVHLFGGLNYWFSNNIQEIQKWAREGVDHSNPADVRHKMIDILYMLDGTSCIEQDVQKAMQTAPGTDNTPDDNRLQKIAAISLLNCPATATPGFLEHISSHLNAIVQRPDATANQKKLAIQINTELNSINNDLVQLHADALQLAKMPNSQITQTQAKPIRTEIDALATAVLSGGTDPMTGKQEVGVQQISSQMQQLATFNITAYKGQ
jgi:serine/threonine protein kinase